PAGLAIDPSGRELFAANLWNDSVSRLDLSDGSVHDIPLVTNPRAARTQPVRREEDFDTAAANKRARAAELADDPDAVFPFGSVLDSRRQVLYVSEWARAAVAVLDLKTEKVLDRWPTGEHPCEMVLRRDGRFLFVANANDNTVSVIETTTGRLV